MDLRCRRRRRPSLYSSSCFCFIVFVLCSLFSSYFCCRCRCCHCCCPPFNFSKISHCNASYCFFFFFFYFFLILFFPPFYFQFDFIAMYKIPSLFLCVCASEWVWCVCARTCVCHFSFWFVRFNLSCRCCHVSLSLSLLVLSVGMYAEATTIAAAGRTETNISIIAVLILYNCSAHIETRVQSSKFVWFIHKLYHIFDSVHSFCDWWSLVFPCALSRSLARSIFLSSILPSFYTSLCHVCIISNQHSIFVQLMRCTLSQS